MTPEMLQRVAELVRAGGLVSPKSPVGDGGLGVVQPRGARKGDGDAKLELPLDRDERGYGEF